MAAEASKDFVAEILNCDGGLHLLPAPSGLPKVHRFQGELTIHHQSPLRRASSPHPPLQIDRCGSGSRSLSDSISAAPDGHTSAASATAPASFPAGGLSAYRRMVRRSDRRFGIISQLSRLSKNK